MILIDNRIGSKEFHSMEGMEDISHLTNLEFGDISFVGNGPIGPLSVGVEIKKLPDLISSWEDGRLQSTQMPGMAQYYDIKWILIVSDYSVSPNGVFQTYSERAGRYTSYKIGKRPVLFKYVNGILSTITVSGFNCRIVENVNDAKMWIIHLYSWWTKEWGNHQSMLTFDQSGLKFHSSISVDIRSLAKFAFQFTGVGIKKSILAAQHFGSIYDMVNSSEKDWCEIDGIGPVLADSIMREIHRRV